MYVCLRWFLYERYALWFMVMRYGLYMSIMRYVLCYTICICMLNLNVKFALVCESIRAWVPARARTKKNHWL